MLDVGNVYKSKISVNAFHGGALHCIIVEKFDRVPRLLPCAGFGPDLLLHNYSPKSSPLSLYFRVLKMIRRLAFQAVRPAYVAKSVRPAVTRVNWLALRAYSDTAKEKATAASENKPEVRAEAKAQEIKPEATAEATSEATAEDSLATELAESKAKYEKKDKEAALLKDQLLRSVADFRNLQETTKREVAQAKDFALQKFAKDLLESVDNFDRALSVVDTDKRADPENHKELVDLYEGIKMTQHVFEKTLEKHGLKKINPEGEMFDPNQHEATFEAPQPDKEPGTVFFVQQCGFLYNDRVIRAAKVGIVKGEEA